MLSFASRHGDHRSLHSFPTRRSSDLLHEASFLVTSVAFSPDGRTLAAGDDSGDVGLWDVATGHKTATLREVGSLVFSVALDRKSTRLNSSHLGISYAVFCLKKKKNKN